MTLTTCYCCGQACYDHGPNFRSTCQACAIEVHILSGSSVPAPLSSRIDPRWGDGFPIKHGQYWEPALQDVKNRKMGHGAVPGPSAWKIVRDIATNTSIPTTSKKTYTDLCPCGIHPSQCDYHK